MRHSFTLMYVSIHSYCLYCWSPPFQEVIKEPLKTFSAALDVLLPRLQPNADVKGVSFEDQQSFVSRASLVVGSTPGTM